MAKQKTYLELKGHFRYFSKYKIQFPLQRNSRILPCVSSKAKIVFFFKYDGTLLQSYEYYMQYYMDGYPTV